MARFGLLSVSTKILLGMALVMGGVPVAASAAEAATEETRTPQPRLVTPVPPPPPWVLDFPSGDGGVNIAWGASYGSNVGGYVVYASAETRNPTAIFVPATALSTSVSKKKLGVTKDNPDIYVAVATVPRNSVQQYSARTTPIRAKFRVTESAPVGTKKQNEQAQSLLNKCAKQGTAVFATTASGGIVLNIFIGAGQVAYIGAVVAGAVAGTVDGIFCASGWI